MDPNERRERVTEEASYWWNRIGLRAPADISAADRAQFTEWLRESPVNVAEMLHMARVHQTLGRFKLWQDVSVEPAEAGNVVALHVDSGTNVHSQPRAGVGKQGGDGATAGETEIASRVTDRSTARWHMKRWCLAAGAAAVVLGSMLMLFHIDAQTVATGRAERREVMLDDGSVVKLEPETKLRVSFAKDQRRVTLQRGRALFHVAKDRSRPFLVQAGNTSVRAVGTAFGVEKKRRNVVVTVAEGKVAVLASTRENSDASSPAGAAAGSRQDSPLAGGEVDGARNGGSVDGGQDHQNAVVSQKDAARGTGDGVTQETEEVLLGAGQQLTVEPTGSAGSPRTVDTRRELAWSEGRLVFDATPMAEVIEEFNRYNRVQLRVADASLAARPVSGVFQASDPETLVAFVRAGAPVSVTREDAGRVIVIESAAAH